ncbi:hypothetical protein Ancab_022733 [Ancistrocladus abbreviatus]
MAISVSCCLNLPPPSHDSNSASFPTKSTTLLQREGDERSWIRSKCVLIMTCTIIGMEKGNLVINDESAYAMAKMPPFATESTKKVRRWSDRSCPPWNLNSYETIVPENLPRPSAHRRWEAVGYSQLAPSPKMTATQTKSSKCFSM